VLVALPNRPDERAALFPQNLAARLSRRFVRSGAARHHPIVTIGY
jgi:hypothetical protein